MKKRIRNGTSLPGFMLGLGVILAISGAHAEEAAGPDVQWFLELDKEIANLSVETLTKSKISLAKAPGAVTVITRDHIRQSGARTITDLLRMVAGVNVRWNPMGEVIDIRGFGSAAFSSRVLLMVDGFPLNSWSHGGALQVPVSEFFDLRNVKQLEVVRGPGSALYGENAYWGVINVVTLSGEDLDGGEAVIFGGGQRQNGLFAAQYGDKLGDLTIYASAKEAQGQFPLDFWYAKNPDSAYQNFNIFLKAEYKGFQLSYSRFQERMDGFELPVEDPALPTGTSWDSVREFRQSAGIMAAKYDYTTPGGEFSVHASAAGVFRNGPHCGSCHAAGQVNQREKPSEPDDGSMALADLRVGLHSIPFNDLMAGIEFRQNEVGQHIDELALPAEELAYNKLAVYVQDRVSVLNDRLQFTAGVRWDAAAWIFEQTFSPRASAVYQPTDNLVLRASVDRAFRFPTTSELYQNTWFMGYTLPDKSAVPAAVFAPNGDLVPERITTLNLGADYNLHRNVLLRLDAYASQVDNLIESVLHPDGGTPRLRFENHPDSGVVWGGELEARWTISEVMTGVANYAYQDASRLVGLNDSVGRPLDFSYMPHHKVNVGAYFGSWHGLSGSVEASWRAAHFGPKLYHELQASMNGTELEPLEARLFLDARVNYDFPWRLRPGVAPIRVSVYGKNLLDQTPIETLIGTPFRRVGREVFGELSVPF
ncbi:MAG: TonB-dependent receptor [Myxococcaceae bacterium]